MYKVHNNSNFTLDNSHPVFPHRTFVHAVDCESPTTYPQRRRLKAAQAARTVGAAFGCLLHALSHTHLLGRNRMRSRVQNCRDPTLRFKRIRILAYTLHVAVTSDIRTYFVSLPIDETRELTSVPQSRNGYHNG